MWISKVPRRFEDDTKPNHEIDGSVLPRCLPSIGQSKHAAKHAVHAACPLETGHMTLLHIWNMLRVSACSCPNLLRAALTSLCLSTAMTMKMERRSGDGERRRRERYFTHVTNYPSRALFVPLIGGRECDFESIGFIPWRR